MNSRVMRVSSEFQMEVEKAYKKNKGNLSRTNITRMAANLLKQSNIRQPRAIINYWPLARKKVRIY